MTASSRRRRSIWRTAIFGVAATLLVLPLPLVAAANGHLQLHFMDVGQGDGAVLITPAGQSVLFDNGVLNQCSAPVAYLEGLGLSGIDYHIASHYHADHIGCTQEVLSAFPLQQVAFDRGGSYTTQTYTRYVTAVGSHRQTAPLGTTLTLDNGVFLDFIAANGAGVAGASDENDLSVAVRVRYGEFDAVFAGDLSGVASGGYADVESTVAPAVGQVEVYKVNHHASRYSSNATWLTTTHPKVGIVSVGAGNSYGHPTAEAMARLHAAAMQTYWTSVGNGVAPDSAFDVVGGNIVVDVPPGGMSFTVSAGGTAPRSYTAWGAQALPPGAPQSLTGTVSGSTVTLNWLPPTTGGVPTSYTIEASLTASGPAFTTLPVSGTSLSVPNVPNGTYFVRVRASNADGQSDPSNEVVLVVPGGSGCTTAPNAPQSLTGNASGSLVTLNWTTPSGGCSPTHYLVQAGSRTGLSDIAVVNVGTQTTLSASAPPGTYFVRLVAVNAFGTSVASNEVTVTVAGGCTSPPNAPQALSGTVTGTQVSLNWGAPASGCAANGYTVQAGRSSGLSDVATVNVGLQMTLSASAPAGTYFLRVVASNAYGTSAASNEVTLTVTCPLPGAPSLGSPFVSGTTVSFSWTPPGGSVTGYVVEAGSSSGASNLLNTTTGATSYTWSGAPTGTSYIRIRATNSCGTGPASNQVTATVASTTRYRIGARCKDGTTSTATGSGACSYHGGVSCWLYNDGTCTNP